MKEGPDITRIAALIGDPARANMLTALLGGKALTARELAHEAGITPQTASSHLRKLADGGLVDIAREGRHSYIRIAGAEVADTLERLSGLAARKGHLRTATGPRDAAMRACRVCYDHLAGHRAVQLYDAMADAGWFAGRPERPGLNDIGKEALTGFGIDIAALARKRRQLCRPCLDWSERRYHLAGALGAALLFRFYENNWARREKNSRTVSFTPNGEREYGDWLASIRG